MELEIYEENKIEFSTGFIHIFSYRSDVDLYFLLSSSPVGLKYEKKSLA